MPQPVLFTPAPHCLFLFKPLLPISCYHPSPTPQVTINICIFIWIHFCSMWIVAWYALLLIYISDVLLPVLLCFLFSTKHPVFSIHPCCYVFIYSVVSDLLLHSLWFPLTPSYLFTHSIMNIQISSNFPSQMILQ